jgi:hypothetical protein
MNKKTKFLNVDLELRGAGDLDELLEALEPFAFAMSYEPGTYAALELNEDPATAKDAIRQFHDAIMALPASAKTTFDGLKARNFDIGIQSGSDPAPAFFRLPAETLALVGALNAEVTFTVYGADGNAD